MKGKTQAYFSLAKKASFRKKDEVFSLLLGKGALQVVAQVNEGALPRPLSRQDEEILVEPGDDPEVGVLEHLDKRFMLTKKSRANCLESVPRLKQLNYIVSGVSINQHCLKDVNHEFSKQTNYNLYAKKASRNSTQLQK
jgi:hypothetical protein